jgi:transcriptional regulator with XRE-family HTH domain
VYLSRYTSFPGSSKKKVEFVPNNFGTRLRSLIQRKGVTISQFARDCELGESQAYNWLKQETPPLAKHWARLADYFGVSTEYIATGIPGKVEIHHRDPFTVEESSPANAHIVERRSSVQDCQVLVRMVFSKAAEIPGAFDIVYSELALLLKRLKDMTEARLIADDMRRRAEGNRADTETREYAEHLHDDPPEIDIPQRPEAKGKRA